MLHDGAILALSARTARHSIWCALKTHVECSLAQIWDHASGKLRKDLEYQAEEKFMMHDGAILALSARTARHSIWCALKTHVECSLAQIWDHASGKLRKDLEYQAEEKFMMHDGAILALNFSRDSELLVSGSQDGKIKVLAPSVWKGPQISAALTAVLRCSLPLA